ncbi:hypothetical protein O7606_01350 [Micromonospora sp. WMMD882]|nr:hypothetical protein [Micromonospora sp. WMMD882]WBB80073.1 hypothetical protein O7606_01350 [Micromonospora sp. WMMD882]
MAKTPETQAKPMKKVTVRKAGPVRLTTTSNALYIPFTCFPF